VDGIFSIVPDLPPLSTLVPSSSSTPSEVGLAHLEKAEASKEADGEEKFGEREITERGTVGKDEEISSAAPKVHSNGPCFLYLPSVVTPLGLTANKKEMSPT